ncbi:MAG: signal peptidase II [Thermus sp.]|uniref:signal peptidase II n=1 Tax=Thermus sp. TaxID=275 RepID=UPI00331B8715
MHALVPLLLVLDQVTKLWALAHLSPVPKPVLGDLLYLTLVHNTGAAFGLLEGRSWVLGWISLLVGTWLLLLLNRKRPPLTALGLGMVAAGALGNAIDRLGRGYVVDFIDLGTNIHWVANFPVFNVADSLLTVGVAILLLAGGRSRSKRG